MEAALHLLDRRGENIENLQTRRQADGWHLVHGQTGLDVTEPVGRQLIDARADGYSR